MRAYYQGSVHPRFTGAAGDDTTSLDATDHMKVYALLLNPACFRGYFHLMFALQGGGWGCDADFDWGVLCGDGD